MKVSLLIAGQHAGEFDVADNPITIGRDETCDLQLDDGSVSGQHARFFTSEDQLWIEDLGSSNGTAVNGSEITAPTVVQDGAAIHLGQAELTIRTDQEATSAARAPGATHTDTDPASKPEEAETQTEEKGGLGKSLMGVLKAGAKEAQRGAKLAGLKAQIEKLKRVDLPNAYRDLGEAAYATGIGKEEHAKLYVQISELESEITEKRKGVQSSEYDGAKDKAQAMARSAKMKGEAELLIQKRKSLLGELGRSVFESALRSPDVRDQSVESEIRCVDEILQQIAQKEASCAELSEDHSARQAFADSSRGALRQSGAGIVNATQSLTQDSGRAFPFKAVLPLAIYSVGVSYISALLLPNRAFTGQQLIPVLMLAIPSFVLACLSANVFIRPKRSQWAILAGALLFTAFIGLVLLLKFQDLAAWAVGRDIDPRTGGRPGFLLIMVVKWIGNAYASVGQPDSLIAYWLGMIFGVGLCEEFTKLLPLFAVVAWEMKTRKSLSFRSFLLIGFFSGLGFGIGEAFAQYVPWKGDMLTDSNIIRWYACVPSHAIYTVIDAAILWYLKPEIVKAKGWGMRLTICAMATLVVAVVHGTYNTLHILHPLAGPVMDALSIVLLVVVVRVVRRKSVPSEADESSTAETMAVLTRPMRVLFPAALVLLLGSYAFSKKWDPYGGPTGPARYRINDFSTSSSIKPEWYGYGYEYGDALIALLTAANPNVDIAGSSDRDRLSLLSKHLMETKMHPRMTETEIDSCATGFLDAFNSKSPAYPRRSRPPLQDAAGNPWLIGDGEEKVNPWLH